MAFVGGVGRNAQAIFLWEPLSPVSRIHYRVADMNMLLALILSCGRLVAKLVPPGIAGLLLCAGQWLFAGGMARAAEPPVMMLVLDGSGSMWGKLEGEGRSKLAMMQSAVRQALGPLPRTTRVGLSFFGHRRGGDCQDTEVVRQPRSIDVVSLMEPIDRLNPRGRGPLTRALREAAGELGPPGAPATLVLVHDGVDNCQQDPCTIVGELRQANPGVRIHVVSLGLTPEQARPMACLPEETGGRHFVVANASSLDAALAQALQLGAQAGPAPSAARPRDALASAGAPSTPGAPVIPAGRPGLQLSVRLAKDGLAMALPVSWRVRRAGEQGAPLWEGTGAAPLLVLPTGRYDVEARSGLVMAKATAEAVAGEPRALDFVLNAGTLILANSPKTLAMLGDVGITLTRLEAKGPAEPEFLTRAESEMALPPGNYLFALTTGTLRIERPMGIQVGMRVSLAGSLGLGAVELSTVMAKGGPVLDNVVLTIFEDDPDAPQGRREIARSAAVSPRFKLPEGTYFVIARRGTAETRDRITVRAGETERHELVLDSGQIRLSVGISGDRLAAAGPISHRLQRLDSPGHEVAHASGATAVFDAAAGRYRLESRIGQGNVRFEREIRLKAGETEKFAIEHRAGRVRLRLLSRTGGTPLPDVDWQVRDASGTVVWSGISGEAGALLMAGRYSVRAQSRAAVVTSMIDVRSGEDLRFDLGPR